jgi:hypothetical protein
MKRLILALLVVAAAVLGHRVARRALASEPEQITWMIDEMCAGFAATRMNPIMAGLATDWFDEALGADRELVRAGVAQLFFEQRESGGGFPYRVGWRSDQGPVVDESGDETTAQMQFEFEFFRRQAQGEQLVWRARVESQLRKRDGEWRFFRTRTETLEGRMLR